MRFLSKCFQVTGKHVSDIICTSLFRLRLLINDVQYGRNLRSLNGMAALHVSLKAVEISIGSNVVFNNFNDAGWNSRCSIWVKENGSLHIGDDSGFNGVLIHCTSSITIGDHVRIGGGTRIFDSDFHPLDYRMRRKSDDGTVSRPVSIGNDVFIGTACIIGKGVTIGDRSIIAAGSVVVKSIPPDEVWGGNPAVFIRKNDHYA